MWYAISVATIVAQGFLKFFFLYKIFKPRFKKLVDISGFAGFLLIDVLAVMFITEVDPLTTLIGECVFVSITLIYTLIFLKGNILYKILANILAEIMIVISVLVAFAFMSVVLESSYIDMVSIYGIGLLGLYITSTMILLYEVFLGIKVLKTKLSQLLNIEWILILSVFLCSVVIGISTIHIVYSAQMDTLNSVLLLVIVLTFILVNILTLFLTARISAKNKEISNLKIVQLVSKQQEESIEEINSKYEEMRKIRHDLKNTVECVEILLDKGKVCEAKEFLAKSVNSSVLNTKTYVNTSESLVNAVLNNKLALCRELNINVDYRILASFAGIDKMSLSVILFNVLDNAIEAEKKIENPYINIEINNFGEYLALIVKNRINGSVLNTNKNLSTTKKDKLLHGIGTKRIKELAEDNGGIVGYYEEDDMFVCKVMIKRVNSDE